MKKGINQRSVYTTLFVLMVLVLSSQSLVWAKRIGSAEIDLCTSIASDAAGNIYVTGFYGGDIDLDPGPGTFTVSGGQNGTRSIFVLKVNSSGQYIWAKTFQSQSGQKASGNGITVDASGNVYIVGDFMGTVDFDPGSTTFTLSAPFFGTPASDIFVCKLDSGGNFLWAKNIGGISNDIATSIACDAGNLYIGGLYRGTNIDFNPGGSPMPLSAAGLDDAFVLKMNQNGSSVWAKTMGSSGGDRVTAITNDGTGNVYTTGYYSGTADFDPSAVTAYTLPGFTGTNSMFLSKLNANGDFVQALTFSGPSAYDNSEGRGIKVDAAGNIYTVGNFKNIVDVDPGPATYTFQSVASTSDIYVVRLDATGNFIYGKHIFSSNSNTANYAGNIEVDNSGNVYVNGNGFSDLKLNPGNTTVYTAINNFIFVLKLDATGVYVASDYASGFSNSSGKDLKLMQNGQIVSAGELTGTCDFDAGAPAYNLTSAGQTDVYLWRSGLSNAIIGIKDHLLTDRSFFMFPNPAHDFLNISTDDNGESLIIYNSTGQQVYNRKLKGSLHPVDIRSWSNGIYYVKYGSYTQRLIKQ